MSIKTESYHALRGLTSQRFRQDIKGRLWHLRAKCAPVFTAWYGTYDAIDLLHELSAHLPAEFEVLMVHSSISDMQPMYRGTARDVIEGLLRLSGPGRTLAMPAFFFGTPELYNRAYYRRHPRFDVRRTPSQMGLVTELFRRWPGVMRSLHPTHSVCAIGPLAGELLGAHHLSPWACGEHSPFGVMSRHKTAIVGLGTEYYRSLTQIHAAEEALGAGFPVPREPEEPVHVELIDAHGNALDYEMSRPISRRFVLKLERLGDFAAPGDIDEWTFKGTKFYATTAAKIDAALRGALRRNETLYVPVE